MTLVKHCTSLGILSLPDDLLKIVLGGLSPRDLAGLSVQCRRLRLLANDSPAWDMACRRRWYGTGMLWTWVDGHGGWAATYRQLAALPSVVVQTVGRSCKVQMFDWRAAGWSGPPLSFRIWHLEEGFQRAMEAVFVVGVEAETDASVLDSYAVDVLRRMVAGWLSLGPDAWEYFLRDMHRCISSRDNGEGEAFVEVHDLDFVAWRRSALEFLPRLMANAPDFSEDAYVLEELAEETAKLDVVLDGLPAPDGVPKTHTWWWPDGLTPQDIVAQFAEDSGEDDSDDGLFF